MIPAATPIEFVVRWRKKQKLSQRNIASLLGVSRGRLADFESDRWPSVKFCLRFMSLLSDGEKLKFLDVMAEHYAVFHSSHSRMNELSIKALRNRRKLHEITEDDVKMVRLSGLKIEGETKLKKKEAKPRGPRKKQSAKR